jgi:FkbM family methyltransferase
MTSLKKAAAILLKNPSTNYHKIVPFLVSKWHIVRRRISESVGIDTYSKPYPGHTALLEHLTLRNGLYVVCGGNDGLMVDPTYYLEKFRGWSGIIVEPLPKAAAACRQNRPRSTLVEAALVPPSYEKDTIDIFDCNAMSITETSDFDIAEWTKAGEAAQNLITEKRTVRAMTLTTVLTHYNVPTQFDLLVLDVEGSEEAVLQGLSFDIFQPMYLLIEIHNQTLRTAIEKLIPNTYQFITVTGSADYLYKRE